MNLLSHLTSPNPDITGDSNIDPLGIRIIWSDLGQDIFNNMISSISNDLRNYTLNLFHHQILKELVEQEIPLNKDQKEHYKGIDRPKFKQSVIIFLENIYTWSMISTKNKVSLHGVLGSWSGKRKFEAQGNNPNVILDSKAEILVRQLGLGVSGRYKTPFVKLGFFDKTYYFPKDASAQYNQSWGNLPDDLGAEWNDLKNILIEFIKTQISNGEKTPQIPFNEIPDDIKEGYTKLFANTKTLPEWCGPFWKTVTGLDKGAAGEIFNMMSEIGENELKIEEIFLDDRWTQEDEDIESIKVQRIRAIEPLLEEVEYLFKMVLGEGIESAKDLLEWEPSEDSTIKRVSEIVTKARKAKEEFSKIDDKTVGFSSESRRRLTKLFAFGELKNDDLNSNGAIEKLYQYHEYVMNQRGLSPWFSLTDTGFKKQVRQTKNHGLNRVQKRKWLNSYYLYNFKTFYNGMRIAND